MSIALVDCNNFFVSCERIFEPKLNNHPVVVLSNNDGCVVSRSQEVKDIGIKMGTPMFKIKDLIKLHDVKVFSSNFELYTDISRRVMSILFSHSYNVEISSIDEGYLDFNMFDISTHTQRAIKLREQIARWVWIPVSVGIGNNKTEAKIATHIAKKNKQYNGVCNLNELPEEEVINYYKSIPINDVWGIGRQSTVKLNLIGVNSIYDFISLDDNWVRLHFDKPLYFTFKELRGEKVDNSLGSTLVDRKSVSMSRTFHKEIEDINLIYAFLSKFVENNCKILRESSLYTNDLTIYLSTNKHSKNEYYQFILKRIKLSEHTEDPIYILKEIKEYIYSLKGNGLKYKRLGIVFNNLCSNKDMTLNLFEKETEVKKHNNIMQSIDSINSKWKNGIKLGSTYVSEFDKYTDCKESLSNRYTTNWNELLSVSVF